jgi:ornithine decarboxylase
VRTLYREGASFDVASMPEFMIVHENIKHLPAERQDWIWDKIIYANPTKPTETLEELNQYKPLVTFDNLEEIRKIRRHAPNAGLALRLKVPNTGAMVELSSKFGAAPGEAVDLILEADKAGLSSRASASTSAARRPTSTTTCRRSPLPPRSSRRQGPRLHEDEPGRHRRRLPGALRRTVKPFRELAKVINTELDRLFPEGHPDPGRARPLPGRPPPATPSPRSSARPCATARPATTSTTASTTPTPG